MIGKVLGVLCLLCDERGSLLLLGVLTRLVRKEGLRHLSQFSHCLGTLMCPHLGLKDHIVAEVTDLVRRRSGFGIHHVTLRVEPPLGGSESQADTVAVGAEAIGCRAGAVGDGARIVGHLGRVHSPYPVATESVFGCAWKMDLFVGIPGYVPYSDSTDDVRGRMGNSMTSSSSSGFMIGFLGLNSMVKVMVSPSH